jgi:inorganic pyrophosphatase
MSKGSDQVARPLRHSLYRAHPWHGLHIGDQFPDIVTAYIEIVPRDTIKYELDKQSGLLKVDRPQQFSNACPSYYGLIPQTFCGDRVAHLFAKRASLPELNADGDPLDICVFSERTIAHSDIILQAIPIGGLSFVDGGQADDKIIAVLENDAAYGDWRSITDCPQPIIERLKHYFLTYKNAPGSAVPRCTIVGIYDRDEAQEVIRASRQDYLEWFPDLGELLNE